MINLEINVNILINVIINYVIIDSVNKIYNLSFYHYRNLFHKIGLFIIF